MKQLTLLLTLFAGVVFGQERISPLKTNPSILKESKAKTRASELNDLDSTFVYEYESLDLIHAYDDFSLSRGYSEIKQQERELVERADFVFASSRKNATRLQRDFGQPIITVPNGVDYPLFCQETYCEPKDLQCAGRPRVGYVGRINSKLNLSLMLQLSKKRTDLQFVLIWLQLPHHLAQWHVQPVLELIAGLTSRVLS